MNLKKLNVEKIAKAIEADAGESLEGLRDSLKQAKAGVFAEIHTPQKINARGRGRPAGSVNATTKEPVKIRLDADVIAALRATGDGWQTRINDTLRASLHLAGRVQQVAKP